VLVDELGATVQAIARDAKIQVQFDPARVVRYRQIGYENRRLTREQFRDDTVDAGEVGSGQSVTALYEVELAPGASRAPLATVRVRYRDTASGRIEEIERRVGEAERAAAGAPAWSFRVAAAAAEFAEVLRLSPYASGTDLGEVADYLRPVALERPLDERLQDFLRLVQSASRLPPP
jgi:Ca-activated chloride channel family protein